MPEKRILAADSVIIKNKKILLVKRKFPPSKGRWVIPGGLVEKNETAKQTCIREAREETGLNVKPISTLGVYDDPKRDKRGTVTISFLCDIIRGKPKKSRETLDIGFFDFKSAMKLKTGFDHRKIIKDAFKTTGKKVLVGGTFNVIHLGHIKFLEAAKSLGDFLVVVVANDKTVLKNKGRLLFSARERKKMVGSVKLVDKVVIGDEKDFFKVVRRERPDIIALGYDQGQDEEIRKGLGKIGSTCKIVRVKKKFGNYKTKKILEKIK